LQKKGPQTAKDLETALKMPKWQVYKSLRNLQKKGTITAILHRPVLFSALPLEKVIDLAAKARIEEAQREQASTSQAILYWQKMLEENSNLPHELQTEEEEVKK
jgi:sugar-specific transcriptional regulator TrmB